MNEPTVWERRILGVGVVLAGLLDLTAWALALHHHVAHPDLPGFGYVTEGVYSGPPLLLLSVLLVRRRPGHRITWLFVWITLAGALQAFTGVYANEALAYAGSLPGADACALVSSMAQFWSVVAVLALFHLFPTGAAINRFWSAVVWTIPPLVVLSALQMLATPQPLVDDPARAYVRGPLADVVPGWAPGVMEAISGLLIVPTVGSVVHLVLRFRRSRGIERQQLRWFVTGVLVAVGLIAIPLPVDLPDWWNPWAFGPVLIWASVAVAILRYRLYDLDRIVSRTLSYAVVTVVLVAVYAAGVLGVGELLPTGRNDLVVAASTLAVAGLFRPLTTRVRRLVDRRFNRARYDAAVTLEAFGARLREEVDLAALRDELRAVVGATLAPSHASVWLVAAEPPPAQVSGAVAAVTLR